MYYESMTMAKYTADNKMWNMLKQQKQPDPFRLSEPAKYAFRQEAGERVSLPLPLSAPHKKRKKVLFRK
jgi:hypothetical protein